MSNESTPRTRVPLLIAFTDFTRYKVNADHRTAEDVADLLDRHYRLIAEVVTAAGGRVVKYIGDASLSVFEADRVDDGVRALLELKQRADQLLADEGWSGSRMIVKAHFGEAVAGPIGPEARYDVLGSAVNTAATLSTQSFAISAEAFRKLAPETRQRFKKHTPPITYIRTEDRHDRA
jgi:class 3 adenylate cyclase